MMLEVLIATSPHSRQADKTGAAEIPRQSMVGEVTERHRMDRWKSCII